MSDHNNELSIMPVKPGTLSKSDIAKLEKANIIVIEVDDPSLIKLIRPSMEISGDDLFFASMRALSHANGLSATEQREMFTSAVFSLLSEKRIKK